MAEFPGVFNAEQKKSLAFLRILWAVLVIEVIALGALVYLIVSDQQPTQAVDPKLMIIATVAVLVGGALGYFLRMQAYKRHWVSTRIERPGYVTGNLLLFALVEIGALVAVVCAYLAGRPGQELLTLLIPLLLLALNFPNGRAMLHEGGQLPDRLA